MNGLWEMKKRMLDFARMSPEWRVVIRIQGKMTVREMVRILDKATSDAHLVALLEAWEKENMEPRK